MAIEQDDPLGEQASTGRMKQRCDTFGKCWIENMEAGGLTVRTPPPKTTVSLCKGPSRKAPPFGTALLRTATVVKRMPPVGVPSDRKAPLPKAERRRKSKPFHSKLVCLVEVARMTPQAQRWCKAREDILPTAPLNTSDAWFETVRAQRTIECCMFPQRKDKVWKDTVNKTLEEEVE